MVLLDNVIENYGIRNIKILFMPSQENPYYKWVRIESVANKYVGEEEYIDTVYFRNDVNGRFEPSIPYCVLQDMIDCESACIILQEHRKKAERNKIYSENALEHMLAYKALYEQEGKDINRAVESLSHYV